MRRRFALSFVTPLLLQALPVLHLFLGLLLAAWTLAFLLRIVLTWYPQVDLKQGAWPVVAWPTEPVLAVSRRVIAPIGGVCLLYTSPSPRDGLLSRMPSSA